MGYKVLITPRSFGQSDKRPFEMLIDRGYELVENPYGRIMTEEEMKTMVSGVDAVILGVDPFGKEVMACAESLKVISRYGVGLDNVDVDYAETRGISVRRTVGANANAVADYAFGLMLDCARKITFIDRECRRGNWNKIKTTEMWGKTIGILGLGAIGKGVAKRASGFNMKVLAYDVFEDCAYAAENNIEYTTVDRIIKEADFISLHLPLMDSTKDLISYTQFKQMKSTAVLVNTARGGVVNEEALLEALKQNQILGAGVDVFEVEPPENPEFLTLDNLVIGSHCAASTYEAIDNMSFLAAENLIEELEKRGKK